MDDFNEKINIWTKIIDVQQHFNDIKSKNHTIYMSMVTAALAAFGYLLSKNNPFYSLPILGAAFFTIPFYVMDCHIYHVLLKGAVECGKDFEKNQLGMDLTSVQIEKECQDASFWWATGAGEKLKLFYQLFGFGLFFLFLILNLPNVIKFTDYVSKFKP